ncbi:Imm7 family immunity protein [Amycolatopsis sp. cmx-4-61]|uniref:Imm7 family immunity protein n=1 Tax=Amycolatopsis sp. cmx-4-61 TaxID=2790937 RepID=UPI00397E0AED
MYEFHGWFGIAESTEEMDEGTLAAGIAELRARVARSGWATGEVRLALYNGQHYLMANGLVKRWRDEAEELVALLDHVAARFPGSYGVLYERSDDPADFNPPGDNAFRVKVMSRGRIEVRLDPFLSPCRPVIED